MCLLPDPGRSQSAYGQLPCSYNLCVGKLEADTHTWPPKTPPLLIFSPAQCAASWNPGIQRLAQTGDISSALTPQTNSRASIHTSPSAATDVNSAVLLPPRTAQVYAYLLSQEKYELERGTSASWERLLHLRHLKERLLSWFSQSYGDLCNLNQHQGNATDCRVSARSDKPQTSRFEQSMHHPISH